MSIALVVGHSARAQGATVDGLSEWALNSTIAHAVRRMLSEDEEGDRVLAFTNHSHTLPDALDVAEAWYQQPCTEGTTNQKERIDP
jgi:hypothetical protein